MGKSRSYQSGECWEDRWLVRDKEAGMGRFRRGKRK